jgi:long-chain acyl-CoA synthetase
MEKAWLQSYPASVPATVDLTQFASVGDVFDQSVNKFADRTALICMGRAMTYRELGERANAFGGWLESEIKLPKGARVALMMPNVLQFPIALFGTLRAGYVVVNCNPLYTERELEHQLKDSGAEVIVVVENFAHTVQAVLGKTAVKHVVVTAIGDLLGGLKAPLVNFVLRHIKKMVPDWDIPQAVDFADALIAGARHPFKPARMTHQDLAFLQYTGGTTGFSKGAMLTHGNIIANLQQAHAWIGASVREGEEVIITALPLYHIFALTANCLTFMKIGATNVLIVNPRDIPGFIKELSKHKFTVITGVNTLFNALLNNPEFAALDFSSLRLTLGGGMAVQKAVAKRWKETTGVTLIEAYGLTETSPAATINPLDLKEFNGTIGLPISSTDIVIRDEVGVDLPYGQPGEICIRGPQVMKGYWQRPAETAEAMFPDGFFRSGDIGIMDEKGFVRIVDRKKDMILVSGFNAYPNEIEDVVAMHPGVQEVAAIGIPDERSGEAVKIFVVRKDPALSAEALVAHCREYLTAYKVPHQVEFRTELPKTNVGKILRRALREPAKPAE